MDPFEMRDPVFAVRRVLVAGLLAGLLGGSVIGCSAQSPWVRGNPVVRWIYYPPSVGGMERGVGPDTEGDAFDHTDYARLLARHVSDGGSVDYIGLERDAAELDAYLARIAAADLSRLSRHAQLAFLLNAYNACTLRLILDYPGIESIRDIPKGRRWLDDRWVIAGKRTCLERLEHHDIRAGFTEPRVHFALVCAAKGCPALRNEPYTGARLTAQLDDQAAAFFARDDGARLDVHDEALYLSEIFDWFRGDFTSGDRALWEWVARYAPEDTAIQTRALHRRLDIRYTPYDWSLNGRWQ